MTTLENRVLALEQKAHCDMKNWTDGELLKYLGYSPGGALPLGSLYRLMDIAGLPHDTVEDLIKERREGGDEVRRHIEVKITERLNALRGGHGKD